MATTAQPATRRITADEFFELPEIPGKRYELVQGEVVEVPFASWLHAQIVRAIFRWLDRFDDIDAHGEVFSDGIGYRIDAYHVRGPDVSFIIRNRADTIGTSTGFVPFAPDLAVEVVSPNDRAIEVEAKVQQYLAAGTRVVWVFWPDTKHVTISLSDGTARTLNADDALSTPEFLPPASIRVGDLFPDVGGTEGSKP